MIGATCRWNATGTNIEFGISRRSHVAATIWDKEYRNEKTIYDFIDS